MKRSVYLSNVTPDQALERLLGAVDVKSIRQGELVPVIHALNRVSEVAVFALCNAPLYDSAAMDGIAVIAAKTKAAQETMPLLLKKGKDYKIVDTGDPISPPFDAVIMVEDVEDVDDNSLNIRMAATPWQHIRPIGEDIVQGEMILPKGHHIRPMDIGALLSGGVTDIIVYKKPRVAVIPTGTELIEAGIAHQEGDIIESNSRMLEALVAQQGGIPSRFAPIADDYQKIKQAVMAAVEQNDLVILNAGSSAGTEDFTVHILRELGEVLVHGVAIKPGKPVILAIVKGKAVIGLPGYPVSAYIAYEKFVAPLLSLLVGGQMVKAQRIKAVITRRIVSSLKHQEYVRVKIGKVDNRYVASPLARGAGAAMSLVRGDGFCVIEQNLEGVETGETVDIEIYTNLSNVDATVVSIGSHDLILDVIADMLSADYTSSRLSSAHVGSMGGLLALAHGEAHIAPIHLLDEDSGSYNIPFIKRLFPNQPMALIKGVGRVQGIMVNESCKDKIKKIEDLTSFTYVNRQRGAGTRILFDYLLKQSGISPESIKGYEREAATHMAVAAAIQKGSADAGMGILSAAQAMNLTFIPIGNEEYDFAIPQRFLELPHIKDFIEVLKSQPFKERLQALGGYETQNSGMVVTID